MEVFFQQSKVTKGAVQYKEVAGSMEEPKIGTLYVRKEALGEFGIDVQNVSNGFPTWLKVTVEVEAP